MPLYARPSLATTPMDDLDRLDALGGIADVPPPDAAEVVELSSGSEAGGAPEAGPGHARGGRVAAAAGYQPVAPMAGEPGDTIGDDLDKITALGVREQQPARYVHKQRSPGLMQVARSGRGKQDDEPGFKTSLRQLTLNSGGSGRCSRESRGPPASSGSGATAAGSKRAPSPWTAPRS